MQAWYLPAELDDLHWQQAGKRARLMATLSAIRSGLPATLHPAGISAFFTGQSSPAQLQRWYGELQQQGWQVWVQDGAGTRALTAAQRKSYLDALFACPQQAGTPARRVAPRPRSAGCAYLRRFSSPTPASPAIAR